MSQSGSRSVGTVPAVHPHVWDGYESGLLCLFLTPEMPTGRPTECVQGRLGGMCGGAKSELWRSITKERGDRPTSPREGARKAWRNQVISRSQERDSQVCITTAVQISAFSRPPNRHALKAERKDTLVSVLYLGGNKVEAKKQMNTRTYATMQLLVHRQIRVMALC